MKRFMLYFWYFISFSFIGWIYETIYYFIGKGTFINSGTMLGPWLPIYGWGGILIYLLSKKCKESPIKVFIISFILSGIIEYATSFYLEKVYGMTWWDYSDFMFNLNGRICLIGLIAFSVLSLLVMYFVLPILDKIYNRFNGKIFMTILVILFVLFVSDFVYSTLNPNTSNAKNINLTNT